MPRSVLPWWPCSGQAGGHGSSTRSGSRSWAPPPLCWTQSSRGPRRKTGRRACSPPRRKREMSSSPRHRADLDRWNAAGMHLVTVLDPDYPLNLRAVHDRPPLMFVAGELTAGGRPRGGGRRRAEGDARRHHPRRRDRRASRRRRIHGRLRAGGRDRHGRAHRGAGARRPDGGGDRYRSRPQLPAAERGAPAADRRPRRGRLAVLARRPAEPAELSDAQRRDVRARRSATVVVEASPTRAARGCRRGSRSRTDGRCSSPRRCSSQPWARELAARPGTHVVRSPERDHGGGRAADARRARSSPERARTMPTVAELTALYANFMLGPRPGPGVCETCFNLTDGYERCYALRARRPWLDAVGADLLQRRAASSCTMRSRATSGSSGEVGARFGVELAAVLWRFLVDARAVRRARGRQRTASSSSRPSRRATSARRAAIRCAGSSASSSGRPATATSGCCGAPTRRVQPRAFSAEKYVAGPTGRRPPVLLIDDTWTTGANAQSAAAALKAAGRRAGRGGRDRPPPQPRVARERPAPKRDRAAIRLGQVRAVRRADRAQAGGT